MLTSAYILKFVPGKKLQKIKKQHVHIVQRLVKNQQSCTVISQLVMYLQVTRGVPVDPTFVFRAFYYFRLCFFDCYFFLIVYRIRFF